MHFLKKKDYFYSNGQAWTMKPQITAFRLKTIKKLNILIFIFSITQILLIFYVSIVTPYLYSWDAVQGILLFFPVLKL